MIDMGYQSSFNEIINHLRMEGIESGDLDYLLPTHVHLDHSGSCGTLAKRFPAADIRAHPLAVPHLIDPSRLIASATKVFGSNLIEQYGLPDPIDGARVDQLCDDEQIDLGGGVTLRAIWSPGHAPHQVSFLVEQTGMVLTGDAVGIRYPQFPLLIPAAPPPSFDLENAVVG